MEYKLTRSEKRLRRDYLREDTETPNLTEPDCSDLTIGMDEDPIGLSEELGTSNTTVEDSHDDEFSAHAGVAPPSTSPAERIPQKEKHISIDVGSLPPLDALDHDNQEVPMFPRDNSYSLGIAAQLRGEMDLVRHDESSTPLQTSHNPYAENRLSSQLAEDGFSVSDFSWIHWPIAEDDDPVSLYPDASYEPSPCEETPENFMEDLVNQGAHTIPDREAPLYGGSSIRVWESMVAVMSFVQSEHLSGVGLTRLLELISLLLPQPNNFLKSNDACFQFFKDFEEPLNLFYYCNVCYKARSSSADLCDSCTDESRTVDYFISLPLLPQIRKLYQRPGFIDDIKYKSNRVKGNDSNIEDIYDGDVYREAQEHILSNEANISLMYNTDGVQVFNSSSFSMWPFYVVVNELPPSKRFLNENMLVAGIWGSVRKPHPNVFLEPLWNEMNILESGVEVNFHGSDEWHTVCVKLLCGTCDAPATALFMNLKSHSGYYSCPVCKIKGSHEQSTVFPYEADVPLRTLDEYHEQVSWAVEHKVLHNPALLNDPACCGVKGPTLLSSMLPNILSCTAIDGMHCVYLGVMRYLLHLWFDSGNRNETYSIHTKTAIVNKKIQALEPPHFLQRYPQTIDKLVYWKATELRSFMFNVSLLVLDGVLEPMYFNHFMLFVEGVALLNTSSISTADIDRSDRLLDQFVSEFEMYGVGHMTHNVHMLLHLGHSVRNLGPLWVTSCFTFEDMNGRLKKMIHGTRHVGMQVHSNLMMITHLPLMVKNLEGPLKKYCETLKNKWMQYKVSHRISYGTYCIGGITKVPERAQWVFDILVRCLSLPALSENSVSVFLRLYHRGLLFVSKYYGRGTRVSSFVKYLGSNGVKYGEVELIVRLKCMCEDGCACPLKYFAVISVLQPFLAVENEIVKVSHLYQCHPTGDNDVVPINDLLLVMFKVSSTDNTRYLSEPLNRFEFQ